jgi:hypothetical protein
MKAIIYLSLWLFVAFVSAYDTYLNIRYPVTAKAELNPLAKFVLEASADDLALLIALKLFGTVIVLSILQLAYAYKRGHAFVIVSAVALAQTGVLLFLTCA